MYNIKILPILLFFVLATSCVNEKYVFQCNELYMNRTAGGGVGPDGMPLPLSTTLERNRSNNGFKAEIVDKGDYLIIRPVAPAPIFNTTALPVAALTGSKAENEGRLYFPEIDVITDASVEYKFKYFDSKPVLQALTIPIKIRPRLDRNSVIDSLPQQTETGFNVGLAFGWKFTHNVYDARKNSFGSNTNRYSVTPGVLLGVGATDLTKINTRNPKINIARKAAMITTGGFLMFGFNSINIGYSYGVDFATGHGSKNWVYQGRNWHGVIVALDVIK